MYEKIFIKTYKGNQQQAIEAFQADASEMATQGYFPISQTWVAGSYGFGAFLVALLLCFIFIGLLVFIYMLIVKPAGTLSVTYELNTSTRKAMLMGTPEEKTCPKCAELVKYAAKICKHCSYEFPSVPQEQSNALHNAIWRDDIEEVKKLIKNGVDINYRAYGGHTPLALARLRDNKELIDLLSIHEGKKKEG